jgi:hypothetical protein
VILCGQHDDRATGAGTSRNSSTCSALSTAWRNNVELHDPSLWLLREPELEEKMLRDADIAHALQYRRHQIAGQRWTCMPRVENQPRAPIAVRSPPSSSTASRASPSARLNLARAFFSGARFARIHGKPRTLTIGDGKPRTWWCPTSRRRGQAVLPSRPAHRRRDRRDLTRTGSGGHLHRGVPATVRRRSDPRRSATSTRTTRPRWAMAADSARRWLGGGMPRRRCSRSR